MRAKGLSGGRLSPGVGPAMTLASVFAVGRLYSPSRTENRGLRGMGPFSDTPPHYGRSFRVELRKSRSSRSKCNESNYSALRSWRCSP